jgi:hypothetical protein
MKDRFMICLAAFALFGCASERTLTAKETHSLAGNRRMPLSDMETFIAPAEWHILRDLEYERYVVMAADIQPNGSVKIGEVIESYPDASWNQIAHSFGQEVILRPNSTDSMLNKHGEIYVVFFKPGFGGNRVLIFGRQIDEPAFAFDGGRMMFRGQQIGKPDIELSHRPKYVHLLNY